MANGADSFSQMYGLIKSFQKTGRARPSPPPFNFSSANTQDHTLP